MRIATLVVAALLATVLVASAQTPNIAVYFDQYYTQEAKNSPGVAMLDQWYIVAKNFNVFVTGAEFAVSYPPAVTFLGDLDLPAVVIGNTLTGISMGFSTPLNGYTPVKLCRVQVLWNASCVGFNNQLVKVVANPVTGFLGVTDFPGFNLIPGVGLTAILCPLGVPTEDTTWGQVKSLYGE